MALITRAWWRCLGPSRCSVDPLIVRNTICSHVPCQARGMGKAARVLAEDGNPRGSRCMRVLSSSLPALSRRGAQSYSSSALKMQTTRKEICFWSQGLPFQLCLEVDCRRWPGLPVCPCQSTVRKQMNIPSQRILSYALDLSNNYSTPRNIPKIKKIKKNRKGKQQQQ